MELPGRRLPHVRDGPRLRENRIFTGSTGATNRRRSADLLRTAEHRRRPRSLGIAWPHRTSEFHGGDGPWELAIMAMMIDVTENGIRRLAERCAGRLSSSDLAHPLVQ